MIISTSLPNVIERTSTCILLAHRMTATMLSITTTKRLVSEMSDQYYISEMYMCRNHARAMSVPLHDDNPLRLLADQLTIRLCESDEKR